MPLLRERLLAIASVQRHESAQWFRSAIEITLAEVAAELGQSVGLPHGLDSLGYDHQVELVEENQQRLPRRLRGLRVREICIM